MKKFNLARSIFWVVLIFPSYFLGWVYSVAFVAVCSLYANVASDFAAYRADDNKEVLKKLEEILDEVKKISD